MIVRGSLEQQPGSRAANSLPPACASWSLKTNEPSPNVGVVPQKLVTRRVAVRGVERRELVEVEWRDAERGVGTTGAPSFSLEGLLNRSAVEKLGERTDTGFRLDLAHPALRRSVLSPPRPERRSHRGSRLTRRSISM
jgi:hypothetical protein